MTADIKDLLATAADDTDRPLHQSVDDIVRRGRRGQNLQRTGVVAASALTAGAVIAAVTIWAGGGAQQDDGIQPAGNPTSTVTVDVRAGKTVQPPPSNLTDAQIIARCRPQDEEFRAVTDNGRNSRWGGGADPLDHWKVVLTQGENSWFRAILRSPDGKREAYCLDNTAAGAPYDDYFRQAVGSGEPYEVWSDRDGSKGELPQEVARVSFIEPTGAVSDATVKGGYFLWKADLPTTEVTGKPIWAIFYDAHGHELARFDSNYLNPAPASPHCEAGHCRLQHLKPHKVVYPK
jgi:hypothetical protein